MCVIDSLPEQNWLHQAPVLGCFGELPQCSNNQGVYMSMYHDAGSAYIIDRKNVVDQGDCWLSMCGYDPAGCGIHNLSVVNNFIPTADTKRLSPICCCHGQNINGQSSGKAGTSLALRIAAANTEVKGEMPQWPPEALGIMKNAGTMSPT